MVVTDKLYEEEFLELKNDILSGQFQKKMKGSTASYREGLKKVKATFELKKTT